MRTTTTYEEEEDLNISVPIAAAITAYSRMIINSFKNIEGYTVYYSDTDSIVLDRPLPQDLVNNELGGIKLELEIKEGVFLGPKCYAIRTQNNELIIKIRGLSEHNLTFKDIESLLDGSIHQTIQTLWIRNMREGFITLKDQIFSISTSDSKREIIRDSSGRVIDTRPYHISNGTLTNLSKPSLLILPAPIELLKLRQRTLDDVRDIMTDEGNRGLILEQQFAKAIRDLRLFYKGYDPKTPYAFNQTNRKAIKYRKSKIIKNTTRCIPYRVRNIS